MIKTRFLTVILGTILILSFGNLIAQKMSGNLKHFSDSNFEKEVLDSDKPVLVDFWASWCPPCRIQLPILKEFAALAKEQIIVGKLSTEKNKVIPAKYDIQAIPTLILFKDGDVVERMVGVQGIEKLKDLIEN